MIPKWFTKKYPELSKNLEINQNRFVTGYDIHNFLKHIIHFPDV